ncbi:uncharacterized protein B0T23DRAFT_323842 [Neurospora hispaniola]|uniref:Uncharacterized protein n=1 Tax=Neurospora hispaniola TaxID=588809 RepID=A0AAJ0MNV4_9PEZI|nr:hypothetical protein B0T23DRAFT_323842 [Neurospora hispaniola]
MTKPGLKAFRPNTHVYYNRPSHLSRRCSSPAMHGVWEIEQTNISHLIHFQLRPINNNRPAEASLIYSTPLSTVRHCISDA